MSSWSDRAKRVLASTQVSPFAPERHHPAKAQVLSAAKTPEESAAASMRDTCEAELFALTQNRGLPILGDVVFGAEAAKARFPAIGTFRVNPSGATRALLGCHIALGPFWIGGEGRIEGPFPFWYPGWRSLVERLVLILEWSTWLPILRTGQPCYGRADADDPKPLVGRLGLTVDLSGNGLREQTFLGADFAAIPLPDGWWDLYAKSTESLARALEACEELDLVCSLRASAAPALLSAPPENSGCPSHVIHEGDDDFGSLHVELTRDSSSVRWISSTLGATYEITTATPTGSQTYHPPPPCEGSPRLRAYLQTKRAARGPHRWDDASFAEKAQALGLPDWPVLRALERDFGGLVIPHESSPRMRPFLLLGSAAVQAAPKSMLDDWTTYSHYELDDEEREARKDAITIDQFPCCNWHGTPLVFIGEFAHAFYLYCDESGAIWRMFDEFATVNVAASSASQFLELDAANKELWANGGRLTFLRIVARPPASPAQLTPELARRLGVTAVPEPSGSLVRCFSGDDLWLWHFTPYGPNPSELRFFSRDQNRLLAAARDTMELCPGTVAGVDFGLEGSKNLYAALRDAGIPVRDFVRNP